MGMPAEQNVDAGYLIRKLNVLWETEMRKDNDKIALLLAPKPVDMPRQFVIAVGKPNALAEMRRHRLFDDGGRDPDDPDPQAGALEDPARRKGEPPRSAHRQLWTSLTCKKVIWLNA